MIHEKAITLKQLRALAAIVKAGTLTAAAETLNVTTPAVSTQLRSLESNLGIEVLKRGPDGHPSTTPAGDEVLVAIGQIENILANCYKRIDAFKSGKVGHVAVGVVSTGKYFAPGLIMQARHALPGIDIGLMIGNRSDIITALGNHRIDLAIMGRPPREPVVDAEVLGDHPLLLIAPPGHPLADSDEVSADELLQETFLCREQGSGTRIVMERFLDQLGDGQPYEKIELGTNETIKQAVIAGLGIAMISAHAVVSELESGRLTTIRVAGLPIVRQWFLVHRTGFEPSAAVRRFIDFVTGLHGGFLPTLPAGVVTPATGKNEKS